MADGRRVVGYDQRANMSTEYTRFKEDYFTGADVRIYFGDIWVDEVTSLQFTLQEQVAPIFGYASYTWDKVARGARQIQGSFTINYKESYYLHSVLSVLAAKTRGGTKEGNMFNVEQWKQGATVEHLFQESTFENVADELEKSLWGASENAMINKLTKQRDKDTFFFPEYRGRNDEEGNANYDMAVSQKQLAEHGFNILIGYGPMNETNGMNVNETAHSLVGVQLTGVSQMVGPDGQPIQEQYSFIAKDLDGNVTLKA